MSSPHHIAADTDGRPYVVDSGNNRVLIFDQILNNPATGAHAAYTLGGVGAAEGIFVNPNTGEIWVSDVNGSVGPQVPALRSTGLQSGAGSQPSARSARSPWCRISIGDLIVADSVNRVTFYYPALTAVNGASFQLNRAVAPNTIASHLSGRHHVRQGLGECLRSAEPAAASHGAGRYPGAGERSGRSPLLRVAGTDQLRRAVEHRPQQPGRTYR